MNKPPRKGLRPILSKWKWLNRIWTAQCAIIYLFMMIFTLPFLTFLISDLKTCFSPFHSFESKLCYFLQKKKVVIYQSFCYQNIGIKTAIHLVYVTTYSTHFINISLMSRPDLVKSRCTAVYDLMSFISEIMNRVGIYGFITSLFGINSHPIVDTTNEHTNAKN